MGMKTARRLRRQKVKNDKDADADAVEVKFWSTLGEDRKEVEAEKPRIRRWVLTAFNQCDIYIQEI